MKPKIIYYSFIILILAVVGYLFLAPSIMPKIKRKDGRPAMTITDAALAAKSDFLSKNGNSSCSSAFKQSIPNMSDDKNIQGSCCSPMDMHRYSEQVEQLKKYKDFPEIPPDAYDINANLAKQMLAHYDDQLTPEQQQAYDYAMQNSKEKGPCCCKCWHWYVYGGLAKVLIQKYNFTGQQITEVWNLSDGCGGAGEHANHS